MASDPIIAEPPAAPAPTRSIEGEPPAKGAMIPTANYRDEAVFRTEMERVFAAHWQFVGLQSELANNRDFVCVDYAGTAIVIQNFNGELKAFQNVCTHRFNRIQTEERGNRPLACRYHGWAFDRTGFPAGMPKREQFVTGTDADASLCLTQYKVETCGQFVFVKPGTQGPDLRAFLGRFYEELETMGGHFGPESSYAVTPHAANWKLLVENVLECYHCGLVHQETFVSVLGLGRVAPDRFAFEGRHSSFHVPRVPGKKENLRGKVLAHLDARPLAHPSFYHIYIYPNLFISSTEGLSFYIGHALPLSPTRTDLRVRLFEPRVELTPNQRARQDVITQQGLAIGAKVIEEDRALLESVQRGIEISAKPGIIGDDEIRIAGFMNAYAADMA